MYSFEENNVHPVGDPHYKGRELKDFLNNSVIKYGINYRVDRVAWFVLGTDICFGFNSYEKTYYIYNIHNEKINCIGRAICDSYHEKEKFLPLLEILTEYKIL